MSSPQAQDQPERTGMKLGISAHFSVCVFCAKPIDDDYNFTVLVWGGVVTVVPIHKDHHV